MLADDYSASVTLPKQYDTDLENFWTQTSKTKNKNFKLNTLSYLEKLLRKL